MENPFEILIQVVDLWKVFGAPQVPIVMRRRRWSNKEIMAWSVLSVMFLSKLEEEKSL